MIGRYIRFSSLPLFFSVCLFGSSLAQAGGMLDKLGDGLGAGKEAASEAIGSKAGAAVGLPTGGETAVGSAVSGGDSSLVGSLTSKLGVTPDQAKGGAGSLFQMAKDKLDADSFQSIADVVPGMDGMLSAAPKTEAAGGLAGAAATGGLTEGVAGGIGGDSVSGAMGAASLANNFQQLGLSSDMVGKFVPVVVDYVKTQGGESVANLLGGALPGI